MIISNTNEYPQSAANMVCTVAKQHMYSAKCRGKRPILDEIINKIIEIKQIEYKKVTSYKEVDRYNKRWNKNINYNDFIASYLESARATQ